MLHIYIYIYIYDISSLRVNVLGGSVHNIKKIAEALVFASKEIGLKVNGDKTRYMVTP